MVWSTATLRLPQDRCPAAAHLCHGQVMECLRPGNHGSPLGYVEGPVPAGWEVVTSTAQGTLARGPPMSCRACPLAALPPEAILLRGTVRHDSIEALVATPTNKELGRVLECLRERGCRAQVARVSHQSHPGPRRVLVDLGRLTPRQLRALRTAAAAGFFRPGSHVTVSDVAEKAGCSRSTLHEHIAKGLDALLGEALGEHMYDLTNGGRRPRKGTRAVERRRMGAAGQLN